MTTPAPIQTDTSIDLARALALASISERRWMRTRHILVATMVVLAIVVQVVLMRAFLPGAFGGAGASASGNGDRLLGVVRLTGPMAAGAEAGADKVIPALKAAFADKHVTEVALYIDSPGGAPAEAERIGAFIDMQHKKTGKPTVAILSNIGASAAYLTAIHTQRVVAGKYSLVGSIGAIVQGWGLERVMDKIGAEQRVFASGKFKAMLNPFKPMDAETATMIQAMANNAGATFAQEVFALRGDKLKLANYDTGEVWNGADAKKLGLIDEVNTLDGYAFKKDLEIVEFGPRAAAAFPFIKTLASEMADALIAKAYLRLE